MALQYIFIVSPGRSGSQYISDIFRQAIDQDGRKLVVEHEPLPVCCGKEMQLWNDDFPSSMKELVKYKKLYIDNQRDGRIYFESNAQFIKAFGFEWLNAESPTSRACIGLIYLKRSSSKIVDSFYANREAPGMDIFADVWNIRPNCIKAFSVPTIKMKTPREYIKWQVDEIEKRWNYIKEHYPEVRTFETNLESINSLDGAMKMLSFFDLNLNDTKSLEQVVGVRKNTGEERAHAEEASITNLTVGGLPSNPIEVSKICNDAASFIVASYGSEKIKEQRREILGMKGCTSCMVGAKHALNCLHDEIAEKILCGVEFDFTDLRWNIICRVVELVDPLDSMFRFVTKIGDSRFILDGLNTLPNSYKNNFITNKTQTNVQENSMRNTFVICVTGATGKIGTLLVRRLIEMQHLFLPSNNCELQIKVLVRNENKAFGIVADIQDSFSQYIDVKIFTNASEAFNECNVIILCASAPRFEHYARYHLAAKQKELYRNHAEIISSVTNESCQILVVANPVVSLAGFIMNCSPKIAHRVTAVTAIDQIRASSEIIRISHQLTGDRLSISGVQALGNRSQTIWIDCSGATLYNPKTQTEFSPRDLLGVEYICDTLQQRTRGRGREIIQKSGNTPTFSVVTSIIEHLQFVTGKKKIIQSVGVSILSETFEQFWKSHFITNQITLPPEIGCIILPCIYDDSSCSVVPHFPSIRRALAWDERAIQSFRASILELTQEATALGAPHKSRDSIEVVSIGRVLTQRIQTIRELIAKANYILIFAGAGMSVSSGIPDITNFSNAFPAMVERGIDSIFKASSHSHFTQFPESAWGFWGGRAKSYASVEPDKSYQQLLQLCKQEDKQYFVCTSNIDRFFARAGFDEEFLFEVHGSLFDLQCEDSECVEQVERKKHEFFLDPRNIGVDEEEWRVVDSAMIPRCSTCGKNKRIATELAVDGHFVKQLVMQQKRNYKNFLKEIPPSASVVVLEIGCGVIMSKLREQASRFTRLRVLSQQAGCVSGFTQQVRINLSHWEIDTYTPVSNFFAVPLPADIALQYLSS